MVYFNYAIVKLFKPTVSWESIFERSITLSNKFQNVSLRHYEIRVCRRLTLPCSTPAPESIHRHTLGRIDVHIWQHATYSDNYEELSPTQLKRRIELFC